MRIKAIIFDLDGVIVSTDQYHYQAWQSIADEEGIYFDRTINEKLRGVSRMASLEIILQKAIKKYSDEEKFQLAQRKNAYYRSLLDNLTADDILPGVMEVLHELKKQKIKIGIGSSSKNAGFILKKIGLSNFFDAVVDGNEIQHSKPDPEVFLRVTKKLRISPKECAVIEDADAGITAALTGGMIPVGVGYAAGNPDVCYKAQTLSLDLIKKILE